MAIISKVLIANRGEIACRAQRACVALGLPYVAVYTQVDAMSLHVLNATESVFLGEDPRGYLDADKLVELCRETGADAIYPGYGFLSESADFAERCERSGIAFIGPTAATMRAFSQKHTARELAEGVGIPIVPGTPLLSTVEDALPAARSIGFPVLLKATGGGGGIGIHICRDEETLVEKFQSASRQGAAAFNDAGVFIEKYIERARHVEVQVFGDGLGHVATFPERECSIQRRHQKVVEETPSPFILAHPEVRQALQAAASRICSAVKFRSAGTVEFILDDSTGDFYFLEVNTRLQVEHGITEMVSNVDLVAWQLQLQGAPPPSVDAVEGIGKRLLLPIDLAAFAVEPIGHAIEVRLCAEDPAHDYRPCTGILGEVVFPPVGPSIRVDTWVETGSEISVFYDSLLAKLMVFSAQGRSAAIKIVQESLHITRLCGLTTNLELVREVTASPAFASGIYTTRFLDSFTFVSKSIEVLEAGVFTTVQDYPGRVGKWNVGIPPSGPMDHLSHRMANALVGNGEGAAALEATLAGPTLRFLSPCVVAVCGAQAAVTVNGAIIPQWQSVSLAAGDVLRVGAITGGARAYIAVSGGLDVPEYLGSRATFPGGHLGGYQGRPLRAGDNVPMGTSTHGQAIAVGAKVPEVWRPTFAREKGSASSWCVGVLPGPHADPDFFTPASIASIFTSTFKVHHNSNRLGIRLEGPRPQFARSDGGEGGSHPSNVHDHAYAIGAINYTGDMPVVLTVDGPSLGGFVCPITIVTSELWKMGQVCPGDTVTFKKLSLETAIMAHLRVDFMIEQLRSLGLGAKGEDDAILALERFSPQIPPCPATTAILLSIPASESRPSAQLRLAGDRYVLLEYGPMEVDLNLRVRVQETQEWLAASHVTGVVETSPGVRSLLIEYDHRTLPLAQLVGLVERAQSEMVPPRDLTFPMRIVHLPIAFNDRWTREAIQRYMQSIRSEAPYLPSNIEFIARNNALNGADPVEEVKGIVLSASYMVMGLGDVYLGAPCAVPVDPSHRLVVPKYNPARTYTPEGAVGIGGSYMCIYPMNSPGGYQLIGRTLPIWNTFTRAGPFESGKPWLLRNFDQVRFYEVSEAELERMRVDFATGRMQITVEKSVFDMHAYNALVDSVADEVRGMKERRASAMKELISLEMETRPAHSAASDAQSSLDGDGFEHIADPYEGRDNGVAIRAFMAGSVLDLRVEIGQSVSVGETLLMMEAMKMEVNVVATVAGTVADIAVTAGQKVEQGVALCFISF